jgi:hypothetical protein
VFLDLGQSPELVQNASAMWVDGDTGALSWCDSRSTLEQNMFNAGFLN